MDFCCDTFKSYHNIGRKIVDGGFEKELYPNIRIVKLKPDKWNNGQNLYSYRIVCGFIKDNPPFIVIKHCPFCAANLFEFYKGDEYVNGDCDAFLE